MNIRILKFLSVVLCTILVVGILTVPFKSSAYNFGGRIISAIPCTCPINGVLFWITVGPPRPASLVFGFGSFPYLFYQFFRSGPWIVGNATGFSQCLQYVGTTCTPIGGGMLIRKIGTSLF